MANETAGAGNGQSTNDETNNGNGGNNNGNGGKRAPGKGNMGPGGITLVTIYLFAAIVVVIVALVVLWPPFKPANQASATPPVTLPVTPTASPSATPTPTPTPAPNSVKGESCYDEDSIVRKGVSPVRIFRSPRCIYDEDRLLLIVLLSGALGSLIHGLRSFVFYVGNRKAVRSWSAYYFALPFIGSGLAFMFYLVIRGGFFSPTASSDFTSPVGFAAVAALIGMFTEQAVQKLKGVSETILAPAEVGKDHIGGPKIRTIAPNQGNVAGGEQVTLAGENFSTPITVKFGALEATVGSDSTANSLTVTAPKAADGKTGKVDVVIINTDGQLYTQRDGYECIGGGDGSTDTSDGSTAVPGEDGDPEGIEGCDVQLTPDTSDEDLPITEGGVN